MYKLHVAEQMEKTVHSFLNMILINMTTIHNQYLADNSFITDVKKHYKTFKCLKHCLGIISKQSTIYFINLRGQPGFYSVINLYFKQCVINTEIS